MRSIKWSFIVFSFLIALGAKSQGVEDLYAVGARQLHEGKLDSALNIFKRIEFFSTPDVRRLSYPYLARIYSERNEHYKSAHYFSLLVKTTSNETDKEKYWFDNIHQLCLTRNFVLVKQELLYMKNVALKTDTNAWKFYYAIANYGTGEIEIAMEHFKTLVPENSQEDFKKLSRKARRVGKINPRTAAVLSAVIPGAGQMYTGDVKSSLNSFLLTSSLLVVMVTTGLNYTVLDAIISVSPWYLRYYMGGVEQAAVAARAQKEKRLAKHYRKIIALCPSY